MSSVCDFVVVLMQSWKYIRYFLEVVTLDTFSDEFADAFICNIVISEADKGK